MEDDADIPLPDSGVPVELDRIYSSLRDLSEALGPNGVNRDGTLDNLLKAGSRNLEGEGRLGNQMLRNLSAAAATFGEGSGDLFATVTELAKFTQVLGKNDRLVRAFIRDLAGMSSALADERVELERMLDAVARSVGTVEGFVRNNRERAGHRPGEADPGHEDHQLRAGKPRHGPPGGAARAGQPGRRVRHQDRIDRLADRRAGHLRRRGRTCSARSSCSPTCPMPARSSPAGSSSDLLEPVGGQDPPDGSARPAAEALRRRPRRPHRPRPVRRRRARDARHLIGGGSMTGRRAPRPPGPRRGRRARALRAASSRAPTTCRCPGRRSTRTTPTRSRPSSTTSSTSCRARW